jgi:hypothetical protein
MTDPVATVEPGSTAPRPETPAPSSGPVAGRPSAACGGLPRGRGRRLRGAVPLRAVRCSVRTRRGAE